MKKNLLFVLGISLAGAGQAQVILTELVHAPSVGDLYFAEVYDTVGAFPTQTGSGQTWDFSTVQLGTSTSSPVSYVDATGIPNAPSNATVSEVRGFRNIFFNTTVSPLEVVGQSDATTTITLSSPLTYRPWPFQLGSSSVDTASGTYVSSNPNIPPSGSISPSYHVHGTGEGTLIAPNGMQFQNAFQVFDTLQYDITFSPQPGYLAGGGEFITTYSYYVSGLKYPALTVRVATLSQYLLNLQTNQFLLFTIDTDTVLEFNTSAIGLETANETGHPAIRVFPNPTTDFITLEPVSAGTLEIFSGNGQVMASCMVTETFSADVSGYPSGIYFVRTRDASGNISYTSFIKE